MCLHCIGRSTGREAHCIKRHRILFCSRPKAISNGRASDKGRPPRPSAALVHSCLATPCQDTRKGPFGGVLGLCEVAACLRYQGRLGGLRCGLRLLAWNTCILLAFTWRATGVTGVRRRLAEARDLKTAFRKLARQWHPVLD